MKSILRHGARLMTTAWLLFSLALAHAAVPATLNYQGFLTDPSTSAPLNTAGTPLPITFKLWDALTAGNLVYSETQSVTVTNGAFNVQIGTGVVQAPPNVAITTVAFDIPYWLEITVGTAQTLAPRQPLASVPYAFKAASLASGVPSNITIASGATAQIGTSDNNAVEVVVNNARVMRYEQSGVAGGANEPNVIGGSSLNSVTPSVTGATIGGGGGPFFLTNIGWGYYCPSYPSPCPNSVTDNYGTVGGGLFNQAGDGALDTFNAPFTTVSGGFSNSAMASAATVAGGARNTASGGNAFIAGGTDNTAAGLWSLAAGRRAKSLSDGCFTFADSSNFDFACTSPNAMSTRATGGIWFVTAIDAAGNATRTTTIDTNGNLSIPGSLNVSPPGAVYFGNTTRQMLNLYNADYAIGVQNNTLYSRSASDFTWYKGGVHNDAQGSAGGGTTLMLLNSGGLTVNGTFVSTSDRNAKENFSTIDPAAVLEKVASLPLQSWTYRNDEKKVKHLGPMAQDFFAAFQVGPDDKHIATVDESGVALAAIQGLNTKLESMVQAQAEKIARLEQQL